MINYYIDTNGNKYIDLNGNYFIHSFSDVVIPTKLNCLQYKSHIYNNGYKKYAAYIYKDGAYVKVKPYINTEIEIAIAGMAIPGSSRVSSQEVS